MATTRNSGEKDGGNNLKKNYTAIRYGNNHGSVSFGQIHHNSDVTSDVMLKASDGEHFMSRCCNDQCQKWQY